MRSPWRFVSVAAILASSLCAPLLADVVTVPVVASLVGRAPFFSDVRVFNTSYANLLTVTATYRCTPGCPSAVVRNFNLGPREARAFDDICVNLFSTPNSLGAVEFSSSGLPGQLVVTSRLYSPAGVPPWPVGTVGSVGMFIPGLSSSEAKAVTLLTNLSNGGSATGSFRTNVGVYNPNDVGVTATIKLYQEIGVFPPELLGVKVLTLGARTLQQISDIYGTVGVGAVATTLGYATVESDSVSHVLFTYAATADNTTQDPVLVVGAEDVAAPAGFNPITPTRTPSGAQSTPTPTNPPLTPTPTPSSGSITIPISVSSFTYAPGSDSPIQVTVGQSTTLYFSSTDTTHGFSGIPALGISGTNVISAGDSGDYYGGGTKPVTYSVTFTAPESTRGQTYAFKCSASPSCGAGHDGMVGTLHVN